MRRRSLVSSSILAAATVFVSASSAMAMNFRLVSIDGRECRGPCPQVVAAEGAIDIHSAEALVGFLARQTGPIARTVLMHSPGGNTYGSVKLGYIMRRLGITAVVARESGGRLYPGKCYSACVYSFAGGSKRLVPGESKLGVHKSASTLISQRDIAGSGTIDPIVPAGEYEKGMRSYLARMGINPALISLAERIPHENIHELSPGELRQFRLLR